MLYVEIAPYIQAFAFHNVDSNCILGGVIESIAWFRSRHLESKYINAYIISMDTQDEEKSTKIN